jgi:hypothetical protein
VFHNSFLHENHVDSRLRCYADLDVLRKLLKNLDPTKATGPDQIPARILKQFAAEFAPHLTTIFNTSITKGEVQVFPLIP